MFCPQCGSTQEDDLRFCKTCGANLQALRQVMATRETDDPFDWNKSWVTEMFMTQDEKDRVRGLTPEMKRLREIKAGVITASVGIALMILLFVLMEGIIMGGRVSDTAAAILSRLWVVGVVPLLVGAALIFNGTVISPKGNELVSDETGAAPDALDSADPNYLPPADTNDLVSGTPFSVTDRTTRHLEKAPLKRDPEE
jgi:hypothetical protein